MAAKKPSRKAAAANLHKQIDAETDDPFERSARVSEETSSDGKFSEYERQKVPGGELILQYRGAPKED